MSSLKLITLSVLVVGVALFVKLDYFEQERDLFINFIKTYCLALIQNVTPAANAADDTYNVISAPSDRLFTKEELAQYHGGEGSKGLYLAILGRVYDVSKGERFYSEGKGYGFFRAIDGTKAYMSGEFNENGLVDNVDGLTLGQMIELEDWIKFYDSTYIYKGKVVGNFYDLDGSPTGALNDVVVKIKEANIQKQNKEIEKKKFPPCNSSWKQNAGKRFWCSTKSGGVDRDWVGVPREMFTLGTNHGRCVCVRTSGPPSDDPDSSKDRGDLDNPNLREYENCDQTSHQCFFSS